MKDKNDRKISMIDNDIEALFDENVEQTGTLVKTIKKARRKTILRNIFISAIVSSILMLCFLGVLPVIKQSQEDKAMMESRVSNSTFMNPNVYSTGDQTVSTGLFSGIITFEQYKIINGKPVDWGERKTEYSLFGEGGSLGGDHSPIQLEQVETSRSYDRYTKQLIMEYYHPDVEYESMTNDFPRLEKMPETAAAELAISFTDKLSPQEVRDLIPEGVSLEWYWVDVYDKLEYEDYPITANGFHFYGFEHRKDVRSEEFFINWLKETASEESDGYDHKEIKKVYKDLKGANKEIKTDQIKILGAVVSGTPKNLLKVKNIPQVRTGVLGAVTTTY
ncbi:anti sigma factor C-terminal domain-containing protein [Peribacillus psychrosaccharolyticus]|uniref:Anti sigma factor C-terminal domain-containing protein n=1 Tax=Peribacillus psychrosaccharolyticus TaxID=1407 RepID=A0A974NMH1_PERPY|nr:anti sigma factor C-terminal domain-containing protein [Peribacillus psychrosaccharolyticus]MEC2056159.1 anti sigma factor C-terminal domain-containing protein [Peribacillus psychrosaccharolyticus]MED3745599.1 anti sigma factor C-terminal domain-containing protein [Peribacillus psychrosaccharolyticus]QQT00651.1 anti sigma factor C-terminal domain-containing protein [Peribacillus psychrosaccharolyticus]